jgi:hypothetical protein
MKLCAGGKARQGEKNTMKKILFVIGLAVATMPFAFAQASNAANSSTPAKTATTKTKKHVKKTKTSKTAKPASTTPTK